MDSGIEVIWVGELPGRPARGGLWKSPTWRSGLELGGFGAFEPHVGARRRATGAGTDVACLSEKASPSRWPPDDRGDALKEQVGELLDDLVRVQFVLLRASASQPALLHVAKLRQESSMAGRSIMRSQK